MTKTRKHHKVVTKFTVLVVLAVLLALPGFTLANAQASQILFIEGTVSVSPELTDVLAAAIEKTGIAAEVGADYFAVTDVTEEDGWLFVSVVGLAGLSDLEKWNIIDHGVWFSFVLVQQEGSNYAGAEVYGASGFRTLLEEAPASVVSSDAKQALLQPTMQAAGETYTFPFPGGYSIHYGSLGVHSGWGMSAVDLGSDGNTGLGHAPNQLIASASGSVTYRCTPGAGDKTTTIRVGEFLYAHLADSTVSVKINDYVSQGAVLGQLQTGEFEENCGYGYQNENWFHVHFGFVEDPLTLTGWTLNKSTQIWSNGSDTWAKSSWKQIGTLDLPDLILDPVQYTPAAPVTGETVLAIVPVRNAGGALSTAFTVDLYLDWMPEVCGELGDFSTELSSIGAGETVLVEIPITGLTAGAHEIHGYVDTNCVVDETNEDNEYGPDILTVSDPIVSFTDGFESGDFSSWTRYNDGGGWLYPCGQAGVNGDWGACVERGDNDRRKQLIDETPLDKTTFNVRFNFDPNGISMAEAERFRFVQTKLLAIRPYYLVLRYLDGQYWMQLAVRTDSDTYIKTNWFAVADNQHTIEINWTASTGPGADDGRARLYMDGVLLDQLSEIDNDTMYVDTFKIGFTSRLEGKTISGIFYLDDVATSDSGYIGLP